MTNALPALLLTYGPLPAAVQHAFSRHPAVPLGALASNPHLDGALFTRLYTPRVPVAIAKALLWRRTLTLTQAIHAASVERRTSVLPVLLNAPHGREAIETVARAGGLPPLSPTAAMLLLQRCGSIGDVVSGQLAYPDACLWLMRRWQAVAVDTAVAAMAAAAARPPGRRRWAPMELAAVVHERGELTEAVVAGAGADWSGNIVRAATAADLHSAGVAARHGSAVALGELLLSAISTIRSGYHRAEACQALVGRADVPAVLRQAAAVLLRDSGDAVVPALPFELEVDWRRDLLRPADVRVLADACEEARDDDDVLPVLAWQAVSALRNPTLDAGGRELLGGRLRPAATRSTFGGVAKPVKRLCDGHRGGYVLVPGRAWAPGGRQVASSNRVVRALGTPTSPPGTVPLDDVSAVAAPAVRGGHITAVTELATERLGDDVSAWLTLLELGRDWTGTVGDLLRSAEALAGADGPNAPAPDTAVPDPSAGG